MNAQTYSHEVGASSDNDVYIAFLQDRYYSNGLFAYLRYALPQVDTLSKKKIVNFEIGQKIYTPYSASAPDPALHDRPFTAYLYAGAGLKWFSQKGHISALSAQVGIMGPSALGKEAQTGYHNLLGLYKVSGWDYQLNNEIALNLEAGHQQLLYRGNKGKFDASATANLLVGNTFSGANVGILLRVGNANPFKESSYANSRIARGSQRKINKELFLFTKPQINFVAYDATIQGGMFIKDKGPITFDSEAWVYSQEIGLNFAAGRWVSKYIVTFKSRELKNTTEPYHYGSIHLSYLFN